MKLAVKLVTGAAVVFLLGWFAYVHSSQTVDLRFGLFTFRGVPLSFVIYAAVILGMSIMLGVGLRNDLRARWLSSRDQSELAAGVLDETDTPAEAVLEELDPEI